MNLYLTADAVGAQTGGGLVTAHELRALMNLDSDRVQLMSRDQYPDLSHTPFDQDAFFLQRCHEIYSTNEVPKLVHCYAGCLTETVKYLKSKGAKVTYTAAAHSIGESKKEHETLGLPYNYEHLTNPTMLRHYLGGYLNADLLIVPSTHSKEVMRVFGACDDRIKIVPHGVDVPNEPIALYPSLYTVGYLGSFGPDKGIRYLLEAWKRLNYSDAMLMLGGRDSMTPWAHHLVEMYGGGCIHLAGWQHDLSAFYNKCSVYCQPSVSEGWGCEVVEAAAHGRPVIVSTGAGACDFVGQHMGAGGAGLFFSARSVDELCACIEHYRRFPEDIELDGVRAREEAQNHSWDKIEQKYIDVWKELLA